MSALLALDCTDRACSVALKQGARIEEIFLDEQRTHARHLLGQIADLLARFELQRTDLDAVVWCQGPGSFTGLRIAAACVQGLSYGLQIPALGVSSLFALALRANHLVPRPEQIWVGLDAHMGEIYTASFARNAAGQLQRLEQDRIVALTDFEFPAGYDLYLGSALTRLNAPSDAGRLDASSQIHAADLLALASDELDALPQGRGVQIEPLYLRGAGAWKKMNGDS